MYFYFADTLWETKSDSIFGSNVFYKERLIVLIKKSIKKICKINNGYYCLFNVKKLMIKVDINFESD